MQIIKWGVIGPGSIATAFAHSIQDVNNSELVSVFGRSKEKTLHFPIDQIITKHLSS